MEDGVSYFSPTTKLYQFQLLLPCPALDLCLTLLRRRSVGIFLSMDDFYDSFCSRIVPASSLLVLRKSPLEVGGYAGVEGFVGALYDVDEIHTLALRSCTSQSH